MRIRRFSLPIALKYKSKSKVSLKAKSTLITSRSIRSLRLLGRRYAAPITSTLGAYHMRVAFAFLCAGLVPAIVMTVWFLDGQFEIFGFSDPYIWIRTSNMFALFMLISFSHVLILGVPIYFLLRRIGAICILSTLASGFMLGTVPTAILLWPLQYSDTKTSSSVNGVKTLVDGVPTVAGWVHYIIDSSSLGACGVLGALVFWFIAAPNKSSHSAS